MVAHLRRCGVDKAWRRKELECPTCMHRSTSVSNHRLHMKVHDHPRDHLICDVCDRHFLYLHSLKRHRRGVHTIGTARLACKLCCNTYENAYTLAAHVRKEH